MSPAGHNNGALYNHQFILDSALVQKVMIQSRYSLNSAICLISLSLIGIKLHKHGIFLLNCLQSYLLSDITHFAIVIKQKIVADARC